MKNKMNHMMLVVTTSLLLFGCTTNIEERKADEEEVHEKEVHEKVEVSKVKAEVTSQITEAVKTVDDAVVSIINLKRNNFNSWATFSDNESETDEHSQAGSGSGAIYKIEDGKAYIFTNNHVVAESDAINVLLKNGIQLPAELVGTDLWTDLAVLSVDAADIEKTIEFGDSYHLSVGEPAIAIGSPLGTEFASSVTSGIISGIGRSVPVDTSGNGESDWEMTAIQTDAAINPGNSGGPLINIAGQVIGINSMKISSDTVEGMGFAIPSNDALEIINEIEKNGKIVRPQLGIMMIGLAYIPSHQQATELNLPEDVNHGVAITRVEKESPADQAGLKPTDIIVNFNGEEVKNSVDLRKQIYQAKIGEKVEIGYYRNGKPQVTKVEMVPIENQS